MATSSYQPLPSPPFHSVPNINNLRDTALYPLNTPSGPIRTYILFRSADVSKVDKDGWTALHELGVAHVFDLRSAPEVARGFAGLTGEGDDGSKPEWMQAMKSAGVERTWVPVFKEADYSPEKLAQRYVKYMDEDVKGFVEAYHDILRDGGEAYGKIFRYLVNLPASSLKEEKLGALVHCTAGKDRTGMFFGMLFDFLGVKRETIAEEYNLTELGLSTVREEIVPRLMQSPAFKNYMASQATGKQLSVEEIGKLIAAGDTGEEQVLAPEVLEKGRQAALRMVGAKKASMMGALEMLDRAYGGAERYMREYCGLSTEDLEALKKNLVVRDGA